MPVEPDTADHRLLRVDRSDDGDDDGDRRSGRRGHRLRAVLRELRSGRDPVRRDAALRAAAGAARPGGDWTFDPDELAAAFSNQTRAIIINTPNNPTGKVFTREELQAIARCASTWNAIAVTDEIYEHILYDGATHIPMASLDGMADRTITINSVSKTFSVTGWRVGWAIAPPDITGAIRKVHDFLTVGAAAPLQAAAAAALALPASYYRGARGAAIAARRDRLMGILTDAGFICYEPRGAYYIMTDISEFGFPDDVAFARHLVTDIGVAARAGQQLLPQPDGGPHQAALLLLQEGRDAERGRQPTEQAAGEAASLTRRHHACFACLAEGLAEAGRSRNPWSRSLLSSDPASPSRSPRSRSRRVPRGADAGARAAVRVLDAPA